MIARELRSELVRLRRPRLLAGWLGLTALFAVLINTVVFQLAADGTAPPAGGPGVAFPSAAELASADGPVAGLSAAASMFGVVTLSFWAVAAATDFGTGLVRLLVAAQPRRWRLLAGKVGALAVWTAAATAVAVVVNLVAAPVGARAAGVDTTAWGDGGPGIVLSAALHLYGALLVWGVLGLVLAVAARSAAVAISCGVGWVLVVESVVKSAAGGAGDWMPGTALAALAAGGDAQLSYGSALALGAGYAVAGLAVALTVFTRRDVTD